MTMNARRHCKTALILPVIAIALLLSLALPACKHVSQQDLKQSHNADHGFFSIPAEADSIVYVVTRNGALTPIAFAALKHELVRSISGLKPEQKFQVVFYSSGPGIALPGGELLPATAANRQAAIDFIEKFGPPQGSNDPEDALSKAFAMKPEVIHLLTNSEFVPSVLHQINRLNKDKNVTVNTISFHSKIGEELCRQIAAENNGLYRHISNPADR